MRLTYIVKVDNNLVKPKNFKEVFGVTFSYFYRMLRKLEKGIHTDTFKGVKYTVEIW